MSRFIPGALRWATHPILTVPMVAQTESVEEKVEAGSSGPVVEEVRQEVIKLGQLKLFAAA